MRLYVSEEISVLFRGIREKESLRRSSWSWVEWSAKSTKDLISENAFFTEYSLWASCTPQLDFRRERNIQPVHNCPLSSSLLCTQARNIQRGSATVSPWPYSDFRASFTFYVRLYLLDKSILLFLKWRMWAWIEYKKWRLKSHWHYGVVKLPRRSKRSLKCQPVFEKSET